MPIYDYLCSNCRKVTEVIHGINDAGPRFCPACGAEGKMRKALSTPAVHFKGSGWAKKDRSSTSGARTKAASSSASADGGSGEPAPAAGASATPTERAKTSGEPAASSED